MKHYSLALGLIAIGFVVLTMAIIYLAQDIKLKNKQNLSNQYLIPNISYLALSLVWLGLGIYLTIIIKLQLL